MKFTGTQATAGLSQALAIVALAGTLLLLALRPVAAVWSVRYWSSSGWGLPSLEDSDCSRAPTQFASRSREVSLADTFQPERHRLAVDLRVCWGLDRGRRGRDHDHCSSAGHRDPTVSSRGRAERVLPRPTTQPSSGRRWMQASTPPLMRASEIAHSRTEKEQAEALFLRERRRRRWIHRAMREQLKE